MFEYRRTSRMPAAEYTFPGKQLPRALGISFVPSLIAGQPSQQRITRNLLSESQQPNIWAERTTLFLLSSDVRFLPKISLQLLSGKSEKVVEDEHRCGVTDESGMGTLQRLVSMPPLFGWGCGAKLLVISGKRLDLMIIEFPGDDQHDFRASLAVTAPPHLQLGGDVVRVLSGKIRNRG